MCISLTSPEFKTLKFCNFAINEIPNQLKIQSIKSLLIAATLLQLEQKISVCIAFLPELILVAKDLKIIFGTQREQKVSNIAEVEFLQMTEIEFSDWYFLFLSPLINSSSAVATDVENVRKGQEGFQYQLSASLASPVSKQVSRSLAEKLGVPISQFSVSSVEQYKVCEFHLRNNIAIQAGAACCCDVTIVKGLIKSPQQALARFVIFKILTAAASGKDAIYHYYSFCILFCFHQTSNILYGHTPAGCDQSWSTTSDLL